MFKVLSRIVPSSVLDRVVNFVSCIQIICDWFECFLQSVIMDSSYDELSRPQEFKVKISGIIDQLDYHGPGTVVVVVCVFGVLCCLFGFFVFVEGFQSCRVKHHDAFDLMYSAYAQKMASGYFGEAFEGQY